MEEQTGGIRQLRGRKQKEIVMRQNQVEVKVACAGWRRLGVQGCQVHSRCWTVMAHGLAALQEKFQ